jgi:outer membrane protein assembly factor BamA
LKLLGEQSFFIPLSPFVLAFHVRAGYVFHQVLRNIVLNERFYLGGANSLRSYEADFTPPFGTFRDCLGVKQFVPQGGKSMININVEVRFPIAGNIWGVIFEDLGALGSGSWYALKDERILGSTGFGLRYNTPIGPLRFDIGWKWSNNIPCDRSYSWFLTFGHLF